MARALAYLCYALMLLPIVVIVGASLTAGSSIVFPPEGLSLRWYGAMLADDDIMLGIWLSTLIAALSVVISLFIGTLAALYLARQSDRMRSILGSIMLSPLSVPLVLTGFALLVLFTQLGLVNTAGLVIGHVVITVAYVLRTVTASLSLTDPFVPRAAAIHGARPWQVIWHVTLPSIRPGLVAGALFTFLVSFNNITISVFLSAPGASPLPVVIFSRMENLAAPTVAAAASATIALTAAIILLLERRFSIFRSLVGGR